MSRYRDERDALRARAESLEQELEAARREVTELKGDGPAVERLERLTRELAEAQGEIARLRGGGPARRGPVVFGGAAGSLGVAVLAILWLLGARQLGSTPCPTSPASLRFSPMIAEPVANGADLPNGAAAACPRLGVAARVASVDGPARVEIGAPCEVWIVPTSGQCKVRVRCGELSLYDGYARPIDDGKVLDDEPSSIDRDPRLVVDTGAGHVEVADDAVTRWSVRLDLKPAAE